QQQREKPSTLFNETQSEPVRGLALPRLPFEQTDEMETVPLPSLQRQQITRLATTLSSRPEIPGFTSDDDPEFEKRSTFPMMVLKGISAQQGKPEPEMKSEVSGSRCGRSRWLGECPGQHPEIWKRFSHPIWLRAR